MGDEHCYNEIGKECGAEQLEDERDTGERPEYQKRRDEAAGDKCPEPSWSGAKQLHARSDGNQVGRDVEPVRHDQCDKEHGED